MTLEFVKPGKPMQNGLSNDSIAVPRSVAHTTVQIEPIVIVGGGKFKVPLIGTVDGDAIAATIAASHYYESNDYIKLQGV